MRKFNWTKQVAWAEAHRARVIALGCDPSVVAGAERLVAQARAAAARAA